MPKDEIATAITRCAGSLADSVATAESIDSCEGRTIRYGDSSQIFIDRRASANNPQQSWGFEGRVIAFDSATLA